MIFVTLSLICKELFVGAGWNAKIQCFSTAKSLYTCNYRLFKYIHCAVSAEWSTHLTKDIGGTRFESLRIPIINFPPLDVDVCLGVFLACYSQKIEGNRTTKNSQLYCLH